MGTQLPPKGHNLQFLAHVCCSQMAGWIKMQLGTKVGLGPGDIVLDGDPAPPKGNSTPNFRPMYIVAKRSAISATVEHMLPYIQWLYYTHNQHYLPIVDEDFSVIISLCIHATLNHTQIIAATIINQFIRKLISWDLRLQLLALVYRIPIANQVTRKWVVWTSSWNK